MKRSIGRYAASGLAALAAATTVAAGSGAVAQAAAAANPLGEPTSTGGTVTLQNGSGSAVTAGSAGAGFAAYAVGSQVIRSGDDVARLKICAPSKDGSGAYTPAETWTCDQLSGFTKYPVTDSAAPASIKGQTNPVATVDGDLTPATFATQFPESDGLYELRLETASSAQPSATASPWASEVIKVDTATSSFTVVYPAPASGSTSTSTSLAATPPSSATAGTSVTFTATVTNVPGSVTFSDGTTQIGSPQTQSGGTASITTSALTVGAHTIKAVFTPTDTTYSTSNASTSYDIAPSGEVPGSFHALTPARILDTRPSGNGVVTTGVDKAAPIPAKGTIPLQVLGRGGVPQSGVSAVVLNLTVVNPKGGGYLSAYPGTSRPTVSNLNYPGGAVLANLAVVPVASDGTITIYSDATADVLGDVAGYFLGGDSAPSAAGAFNPVAPTRILDTRPGTTTGVTTAKKVPAKGYVTLQVTGHGGVPAGAAGIVINTTVVQPTSNGYLSVLPQVPTTTPTVSNVNYGHGQIVANEVVVPLDSTGKVTFYSDAETDVLADVSGYFLAGTPSASGTYVPVTPTRITDTRSKPVSGPYGLIGRTVLQVQEAGTAPLPSSHLGGVVANLTAVQSANGGYLTIYPDTSGSAPLASNVNYLKGSITPNLTIVAPASDGKADVYSTASTNVLLDVSGYFLGS